MRKFKYSSPIKDLEFQKEKKRISRNWGKIIYQMVIAFILISLFVFLGSKILFSISKGEITATRFSVSLPFAIRIEQIFVEEDDTINTGDLLFTYNTAQSIENFSKDAELWLLKERMTAKQKVELARIEIRKIERVLSIESAYSFKILEMVRQNLKYREEYDEHLYKVEQLQVMLEKLQEEYFYYDDEYRKLNGDFKALLQEYHTDTARYYNAPMDGVVNRILSPELQFMNGTEIMKIINNDEVHAYAYVELRNVNRFAVHDKVTVIFPDYHQGRALITHIYREVELLPEDLRILDGDRYAMLKLTPIGIDEKEKWSRLDGTTVKVITTNFKNRAINFEFLKREESDSTNTKPFFGNAFNKDNDSLLLEDEDTLDIKEESRSRRFFNRKKDTAKVEVNTADTLIEHSKKSEPQEETTSQKAKPRRESRFRILLNKFKD